jgi:hypothetical protein
MRIEMQGGEAQGGESHLRNCPSALARNRRLVGKFMYLNVTVRQFKGKAGPTARKRPEPIRL